MQVLAVESLRIASSFLSICSSNTSAMLAMLPILQHLLYIIGVYLILCSLRAIFRKYTQHGKTWFQCILDALLEPAYILRLGRYNRANDIDSALLYAMKSTKLASLCIKPSNENNINSKDDMTFVSRYSQTRKLGQEVLQIQYSPLGYLVVQGVMQRRMETRLRFIDYLERHPQIERKPLKSDPIFVIGFPRTGTTFLHELLGLHPKVRMHYTWEQISPVPNMSISESYSENERLQIMRSDRKQRYDANYNSFGFIIALLGDAIQRIHRIGYDEPEECTTPCSMELPWAIPELPFHIASSQLLHEGAGNTFKYYRKYLQLLSWQNPAGEAVPSLGSSLASCGALAEKTWMLKCPFHLPYLDALTEEFPECTIVWTHRDPVECIASACSLYEVLAGAAVETASLDKHVLGKAVLDYTETALKLAQRSLDRLEREHSKVRVMHIRYSDNIRDPVAICKDIFRSAGIAEDGNVWEDRSTQYLAKNKAEREGMKGSGQSLHSYTLNEYGLSDDIVRERFREYTDRYSLVKQ